MRLLLLTTITLLGVTLSLAAQEGRTTRSKAPRERNTFATARDADEASEQDEPDLPLPKPLPQPPRAQREAPALPPLGGQMRPPTNAFSYPNSSYQRPSAGGMPYGLPALYGPPPVGGPGYPYPAPESCATPTSNTTFSRIFGWLFYQPIRGCRQQQCYSCRQAPLYLYTFGPCCEGYCAQSAGDCRKCDACLNRRTNGPGHILLAQPMGQGMPRP
jgi:hypothetical protein